MGDIVSYVYEYGGFTFAEKPFCEIDGLLLSHFSYYIYTGIVPTIEDSRPAIKLSDAAQKMDWNNFISVKWEPERNRELFYKTAFSRRYRNMALNFLVEEIDEEKDMQFCAVTFLLGNGDVFLSFRGTDDALIGWHEDFNMAYRTPVEAQIRSTEYVNKVVELLARKRNLRLYLGGHSKGGNLAVYSAMTCKDSIKPRIGRIYNMDGPGFRPDFMEKLDYDGIKDKILKIVPSESFVGLLMENGTDYELIESSEIGLQQHVCFSWNVVGDRFERTKEQVPKRKGLYDRINYWIYALDRERVGAFLDALFSLAEITEARTLTDLKEIGTELPKFMPTMMQEYSRIDSDTKHVFWEISLFMVEVMAADQQERVRRWKAIEKIRQRLEHM
ncbi:MAG: DUF2974 domain-containing protein [Lachnospiraceae bacterium]|nr:DUF2974 domain-containing protein [Lachnospiraceae bacterium]